MKSESRGWNVVRHARRSRSVFLLAAAAWTGLLAVPAHSAGGSKQVSFNCPVETTRSVRLSSAEGDVEVRVGDECICDSSKVSLDMGAEIATKDLVTKMIITKTISAQRECPSCGEDVRSDARFCDSCGEKLETVRPALSGNLRCPSCGEDLEAKKHGFLEGECPSCGEDLDVYLDTLWARLVDQSSLVRLWGGELPAPGQRSTVRIYCYDKPAVFVYWKSMLAAELGQ
jgi:predicted RNA-binding Zn-ribbon protein involved in translation (DUF1610 family)